jgi:hypothetical protein
VRMAVDGIDQGSINVEDHCLRHWLSHLPADQGLPPLRPYACSRPHHCRCDAEELFVCQLRLTKRWSSRQSNLGSCRFQTFGQTRGDLIALVDIGDDGLQRVFVVGAAKSLRVGRSRSEPG